MLFGCGIGGVGSVYVRSRDIRMVLCVSTLTPACLLAGVWTGWRVDDVWIEWRAEDMSREAVVFGFG
jgi:hypothetical protein